MGWREIREQGGSPVAWRRAEASVVGIAVLAVIVLGVWGFRELGASWSTSTYRTLQLFALGGPDGDVPWQIGIARLAAPFTVAAATVTALLTVFRDQVQDLALLRLRNHVVVAGGGDVGVRLAARLHREGERVALIDVNPDAPSIRSARGRGISVVLGDATDPQILDLSGSRKACRLIVACGDDATNLNVLAAARRMVSGGERVRPLAASVAIDDSELWRLLQIEAVGDPEVRRDLRIDYFSLRELASRLLALRAPFADPTGDILIIGSGPLVRFTLEQVAMRRRRLGYVERQRIGVCRMGQAGEEVDDRYEHLGRAFAFEPLQVDSAGDLWKLGSGPWDGACIACESEAQSLAAAAALAASGTVSGTSLVVVRDLDSGVSNAIADFSGPLARTEVFGVYTETLEPSIFDGMVSELLARGKHAQYMSGELTRNAPSSSASKRPWEELDETYREENRAFADSIGSKLAELGFALAPTGGGGLGRDGDGGVGPSSDDLEIDPDLLERLAIAEHERWVASRARDGWSVGARDEERRRHPSMVEWSELSSDDRERDREPIRALPSILAMAGLEIVPIADPGSGAGIAQS